MNFTERKWSMDRFTRDIVHPIARKISFTGLKHVPSSTQQTLSPRKPMKADHSILNNNHSHNSKTKTNGLYKSSAHILPQRPLCREKSNSFSNINSPTGSGLQFYKQTNEYKRSDKYTIDRPLSPRSRSNLLIKNSQLKLQKLNEDHKPSSHRLSQPVLRRQPSINHTDSKSAVVPRTVNRSSSFSSGNLSCSQSSLISQIDANVPLPGIPRTRRNSFDSSSLAGSRPASRNSSINIDSTKNFMSGKSTLV